MAIVFDCPHCKHTYRLKDEFAGRKATCKNPDCRQQITIPAPLSAAEAEAAAHSALVEEAPKPEDRPAAAPAEKVIPMTCSFCGHNWTEPMAKAGKNTLCPECRQRVKVPEPKEEVPQDWRQQKTKLPSLAKQAHEKLEGVQDAAEVKIVSGEALREADATGEEYEPIPLKRKLTFVALGLAVFSGLSFGIYRWVTHKTETNDHQLLVDGWKEFSETSSKELAPGEAPLWGALFREAEAEYALRQNADKNLEEAHGLLIAKALTELRKAPPTGSVRYFVAAEIASAVVAFGGNDDDVKALRRLPWRPDTRVLRPGGQRTRTVHEEIQKPLSLLMGADFDLKIAVARRLTRELVKKGQADFAAEFLPLFLFTTPEQDEARAVVALEIRRADAGSPVPQQVAEALKSRFEAEKNSKSKTPSWNPYPASAQTLFSALGMDFRPLAPPQATGGISEAARIAYTGKFLLDNQPEQALEMARRGVGSDAPAQIKALVLCAEWMPDPAVALDTAIAIVKAKEKRKVSPFAVLRLAQIGFEKGKYLQAKELADSLSDDSLKAWAYGDGVRLRVRANANEKAEDGWFEVPSQSDKLRAGHAWGRYWIARQNARLSGDRTAEKRVVDGWSPAPLRPFGLAGIALGLQDR